MAENNLPYMNAYGAISKTLEKIKAASTPSRFTQDFLSSKLSLKGGSAKPVIPFLKRVGFLATDGSPTELYKQFRNSSYSGSAAAKALRTGYAQLYEMNEYAHELNDTELKGLIVQATGGQPESSTTKAIIGSFKALKSIASFEDDVDESVEQDDTEQIVDQLEQPGREEHHAQLKMGLSYTINLNLPSTSDIAVFNAIFKSLKDHLLK